MRSRTSGPGIAGNVENKACVSWVRPQDGGGAGGGSETLGHFLEPTGGQARAVLGDEGGDGRLLGAGTRVPMRGSSRVHCSGAVPGLLALPREGTGSRLRAVQLATPHPDAPGCWARGPISRLEPRRGGARAGLRAHGWRRGLRRRRGKRDPSPRPRQPRRQGRGLVWAGQASSHSSLDKCPCPSLRKCDRTSRTSPPRGKAGSEEMGGCGTQ